MFCCEIVAKSRNLNLRHLCAGELGGTVFGYIPDAFSNDLPELPSESANRAKSRELSAARERDCRDIIQWHS